MRLYIITVCPERQYKHFSLSEQEDNFRDTFGVKCCMPVAMKKSVSFMIWKNEFYMPWKIGKSVMFISYEKLMVSVFGEKRQCSSIGKYLWRGIFQNNGATLYKHILFIIISETESF